jgi:hypothetical protein
MSCTLKTLPVGMPQAARSPQRGNGMNRKTIQPGTQKQRNYRYGETRHLYKIRSIAYMQAYRNTLFACHVFI